MSWFSNWGVAGELKDKNALVREKAARTLGQQKSSAACKSLLAALPDEKNEDVRVVMIGALSQINDSRAIEPLLGILENTKAPTRERLAAQRALQKLGKPVVTAVLERLRESRNQARTELIQVIVALDDPRIDDAILLLVEDVDPRLKKEAIHALGERKCLKSVPMLIELIKNPGVRWLIRAETALALGAIGSPQALPVILELASDQHEVVRTSACRALGRFRADEAFAALSKLTRDASDEVKAVAAEMLGHFADSRAVKALMELTKNPEVARAAVEALLYLVRTMPQQLLADDLKPLAHFADVETTVYNVPDDEDLQGSTSSSAPTFVTTKEKLDCSVIRQIAGQELARRGGK